MNDQSPFSQAVQFIRLSRPHFLVGGFLLYALGSSIAGYLGHNVGVSLYLLGQGLVSSLQLGANYLNEYFDVNSDLLNNSRSLFTGGSGALESEGGLDRQIALYAAIAALTFAGTIASILVTSQNVDLDAWAVLALAVVGTIGYSLPPVRLVSTGYGELAASFIVAGLVPTFSFALQTGDLHRLLVMSTVPLVALLFAAMIVFDLPDYVADLKAGKETLVVRIGWEAAMRVHGAAVGFAFVTLLMAYLLGLPRQVALGSMIALPLGIAEVWMLWRVRQGDPPRWSLLTSAAVLLFGLSTYLQLAGYWLS